jgi:hypothetical protein
VVFRDRLLATLRAAAPLLEEPGVLVVGSEVPNLLEPDAASTLVVSKDVDLAVPVSRHADVKRRLDAVRGLRPSREEPSVWLPEDPQLLELNFVGRDEGRDPTDTYVLDDDRLPLMVFGPLALVKEGTRLSVAGLSVPLPQPAGLVLEKLVTERTGEKGERDLLVALGLLVTAQPGDIDAIVTGYSTLSSELRYAVRSSLTVLSLLRRHASMPDPERERARVVELLRRLEAVHGGES